MWRWLLERVPKRFQLWVKLAVFSAAFHGIVLFMLLFLYQGSTGLYQFDLSRIALDSEATIVFMPLHKSIAQKPCGKKGGGLQKSKHKRVEQQAAAEKKQPKADKEKAATTLLSEKQKKKATKKVAKNDTKKKKQKEKVKEPAAVKKELAQKKEPEQKPAEELKTTSTEQNNDTTAVGPEGSNIIYVGRDDLEAFQLQQAICQEINEHWKPPFGVPHDKVCEVRMLVDWEGKIKNVTVTQPSGIAMYDISARTAVQQITVPKAAWGKELSITFKQT